MKDFDTNSESLLEREKKLCIDLGIHIQPNSIQFFTLDPYNVSVNGTRTL